MAASDSTFFLVNVGTSNYQNRYAKISPEDAELVLKHKWSISATTKGREKSRILYASADMRIDGVRKRIKMHRLIMNAPEGMHVDHINGDGLDNRRENLRIVTQQENTFNSRKHFSGYSVFKGVSWSILAKKWRAYIAPNRKQIHIGLFESEIEAAKAYDEKAKELFGPYAKLNLG